MRINKKKLLKILILIFFLNMPSCYSKEPDLYQNSITAANLLIERKNFNEAENLLKKLIKNNPKKIEAYQKLIALEIDLGHYSQLDKLLTQGLKAKPGNTNLHALKAQYLFLKKDMVGAQRNAEFALSKDFRNAPAYQVLGEIYFAKQDYTTAFKNYYLAFKYNPKMPEAYYGMAKVYLKDKRYEQAYNEILKLQEFDIKNPEILFFIAKVNLEVQKYDKAIDYLKKSIYFDKGKAIEKNYLLGQTYEKIGELDNAYRSYSRVLAVNPDYENLASRMEGLYEKYQSMTYRNVPLRSSYDEYDENEALFNADYMFIISALDDAKEKYKQVLQHNPDNMEARIGIVEIYYTKINSLKSFDTLNYYKDLNYFQNLDGEYLEIEKIKADHIKTGELNIQALENLASGGNKINKLRAECMLGKYKEADETLKELMTVDLSENGLFQIAKYLYYEKNYINSRMIFKRLYDSKYSDLIVDIVESINAKEKTANDNFNKAKILYKEKKYNEATALLKKGVNSFPEYSLSYLQLAYCSDKLKKYDDAITYIQKYQYFEDIHPSNKSEIKNIKSSLLIKNWQRKSIKKRKEKL